MNAIEELAIVEQKARERKFFEAQNDYNHLVKKYPHWAEPRYGLAQTRLILGQYKEGFLDLEARWDLDDSLNRWYKNTYDFSKYWKGECLDDKTILVFCEQGLGDAIQFVRYIPYLNGRVIVHAHKPLAPLLDCETVVGDIGEDVCFPAYDYTCSTISLPYLLQDFNICGEPYLFAEPKGCGIGVIWGGTPGHPLDQDPASNRSIPVQYFNQLDADLYSLQLEPRTDLGEPKFPSLTNQIHNLRDTAEIMMGMDLIITCDTSTAHLAGALGCPCWVLLPYVACWRWGLGETTPWYNSIRIFRQLEPGNWDAVFDEVAKQLAAAF